MKCIIWGVGKGGIRAQKAVLELGYTIECFVDSYIKNSDMISGYRIIHPQDLEKEIKEADVDLIIIGVMKGQFVAEIEKYLVQNLSVPIEIKTVSQIYDIYREVCLKQKLKDLSYKWNIYFNEQAEQWIDNLKGEVRFHLEECAQERGRYHEGYLSKCVNKQFGDDTELTYLRDYMNDGSVVMDLGCGLMTKYGTKLPNGDNIRLIPVDPLAYFYNKINAKYANDIVVKDKESIFGLFEFIADFFDEGFCDVIVINNALDHGIDPYKSILESLYIIREGGILFLNHRPCEALYEAYDGLHKWNIDATDNGDFIIWNEYNAVNVSQKLSDIAEIKVYKSTDISWELSQIKITIIKKKQFLLSDYIDIGKESQMLAFLLSKIMSKWVEDSLRI